MIRNLKALMTAVAAVLALGALTAAGASAAQFHSEAEPTKVELGQTSTHVLAIPGYELKCEASTMYGTMATKTAESITLTPGYGLCKLFTPFGYTQVAINFNGCDYKVFADGSQAIECPVGRSIEISGPGCTIKFSPGTYGTNTFSNGSKDVNVTFNLSGVPYSTSGFLCGMTSGTTGTYKGSSTAKGKNSGGTEVKIWHE